MYFIRFGPVTRESNPMHQPASEPNSTHKSKADKRADGKRSRGGLLDLLRRLQFWNQQLKHQQR